MATDQSASERPRVYVAGPYDGGDWGENIQRAVEAGEQLWNEGYLPFIPHTHNALWSVIHPKPKEEWLRFDIEWLDECDALVRLEGESPGSDTEVGYAMGEDIPVYHGVEELLNDRSVDAETDCCEMPTCDNVEGLKPCSDPENNRLLMCPDCRSDWPVEVETDGGTDVGGTERKIAEWQEQPYTAHDRRRARVYHRVVLFVYDHGVDVEHQAKGDERADMPTEWTPVNVWEVRNGRVSKLRQMEVLRS